MQRKGHHLLIRQEDKHLISIGHRTHLLIKDKQGVRMMQETQVLIILKMQTLRLTQFKLQEDQSHKQEELRIMFKLLPKATSRCPPLGLLRLELHLFILHHILQDLNPR